MLFQLQHLTERLRAFFLRHFLSTFRSTVLSFYIPVIIAFILVTGTSSYILAMRQVEESARHEIENLVHQNCIYTDNRFQSGWHGTPSDVCHVRNLDGKLYTSYAPTQVPTPCEALARRYKVSQKIPRLY